MVGASGTAGRDLFNIRASSRRLTSHVLQHLHRVRQVLRTSAEMNVSARPEAQQCMGPEEGRPVQPLTSMGVWQIWKAP